MNFNEEALKLEIEKLKKERDEALELAEQRNLFISSISHEIRSPINAILGLLNLYLEENTDKEQDELFKNIKFSANHLLKLLNDILNYTRIESQKIELEEINFNLKENLERIQKSFYSEINSKNLTFSLEIDSQIPNPIIGDSLRLSQIITNLVSNAVKFTESGSVSILVKLLNKKANLVELEFSVLDTGIGIPKEQLDKIFSNFVQGEKSISRIYGGTGLGLAISKKLLELMESNLKVESEINKGSNFSFVLYFKTPLVSEQTPRANETSPTKNSLNGFKVLLVEDNISNQKVASRYLQKWQVEVDIAANGIICLEKMTEKNYDLVLMDLQMPEMDGYTAANQIRKKEAQYFKEIPIIALTASALLDTQKKVEDAGMNDYLTKPFNPNDLYNTIAKYYKKK